MPPARLRIVSDIHFAETGSRVQKVRALEPLLEGAAELLLNGDSVETRFLDLVPETVEHKRAIEGFVAAHGGRVALIAGNHDPDICARHFLELEAGRVLVTHGDIIFPEMAPWGWEAAYFEAEQERRLMSFPLAERRDLATRLRVCKEAILAIRDLSPRFPGHSSHPWRRRLRFLLGARRVVRILRSWWTAPTWCARMAATYRPSARVVVFGHTHYPGLWRRDGRVLVNTGSCVPPLGGLAVDFVDRRLELRRLEFRRGEVRVGKVRVTLDLDEIFAAELPSTGA